MPTANDIRLPMPPMPRRHVPRPRLTAALDAAEDEPLVLVSAGPGAGKTVLLSEWARGVDTPVAWFAPKPDDNDPLRFWRQLRAAVRASGALDSVDLETDVAADDAATDPFEALFRDIQRPQIPIVIIIDDAHVLTDPEILDGFDSMVQSRRPRVRLVLAARSDPMLPLHRYRMAGEMFELRAADLAATPAEARAILEAHGVNLTPGAFEVLTSRTEGWIAGLRLSAMRMEGTERPADFVAEFAVDQGSIGEYLTYEVLDRLPENVRQMLIQTAFLDAVSGELADAITGQSNCTETLYRMAHTNSFVIPLDAAYTRYRYHHLLAEILRYLLQRQGDEFRRTRFGRAAAWFEEQNDYQSAFHWAVSAEDTDRAASLLARGVIADVCIRGDVLVRSDLLKLRPLAASTDASELDAAELSIARSAVVALTADSDSAARELDCIEHDPQIAQLPDTDLQLNADLTVLTLGRRSGDAQATELAADRIVTVEDPALNGQGRGVRACAMIARAQAQFWDGRHDDVEAQLGTALALAQSDGYAVAELHALGMLALANRYWSRKLSADDAAKRADDLISSSIDLTAPITLELAAAQRAYDAADFQVMSAAVSRALAAVPIESDLALAALAAQMRARLLLATGQVSGARSVLEAAPSLRRGTAMLQTDQDILLATVEIALGRPHRALRLLERHREGLFEAPVAVTAAKAYLALGDLDPAENCIRKVVAGPAKQRGRGPLVDALLCSAQIAQLRDDPTRAVELVCRAIEIADGDFSLPFFQLADVFAPLLGNHPLVAAQWPATVHRSTDQLTIVPSHNGKSRLPEPLTEREQAVLRFLATTMSTAEIAAELYLSVNTIKTHLGSIYRKLAANRRKEAVVRARELELL
jgi:LuxR family transcriptional regulator, maltose regulon positive regulatory protein